jgi:hypothetical protein
LEPLKLLQKRLNFLVRNANNDKSVSLEEVMKRLIKLEAEDGNNSPSAESWEDISINTPIDGLPSRQDQDVKASLRIDGNLFGGASGTVSRNVLKFKLPSQPVIYAPKGMQEKSVEKIFDVSAKALFHVLFGDKSAVFELMYQERQAQRIQRGPWIQPEQAFQKREFEYQTKGSSALTILDYQVIEVLNDHLCYEVMVNQTPWHLPYANNFRLINKIVITHHSKSQCKLAIFSKVEWLREPRIGKGKDVFLLSATQD